MDREDEECLKVQAKVNVLYLRYYLLLRDIAGGYLDKVTGLKGWWLKLFNRDKYMAYFSRGLEMHWFLYRFKSFAEMDKPAEQYTNALYHELEQKCLLYREIL